jgi:3-oxoacyl-[acyl-carrier protein] reductase
LSALGVRVAGIEMDLSRPETPTQLLRHVNEVFGPVHILVNNAAYSSSGDIHVLDADTLDRHYAVNVRGMILLCQAFVDQYPGGDGGRIINLTSGQNVEPMPDELAYATSKGAVEAFTISLSAAVAPMGITVNAVDPGPTDTGWMSPELKQAIAENIPLGRVARPEDAAGLIRFLASPAAGYITGQIIHSRGGL